MHICGFNLKILHYTQQHLWQAKTRQDAGTYKSWKDLLKEHSRCVKTAQMARWKPPINIIKYIKIVHTWMTCARASFALDTNTRYPTEYLSCVSQDLKWSRGLPFCPVPELRKGTRVDAFQGNYPELLPTCSDCCKGTTRLSYTKSGFVGSLVLHILCV